MKTYFFKLKFIISLVFIVTAVTSCKKEESKDVSQEKIYAEYELFYDKNQDKTYASAIFKFSNVLGTQLQLTAPSEVRCNGDIIPYDPVFAYYRKEYAGQVTTGTFVFKDTDGKSYTNVISNIKTIANPAVDTISKSSSYTYTWVGDALTANESAAITVSNTANGTQFQYFFQNTISSTNFVMGASNLNNLPTGMATCHLERTIETAASAVTSAGGKIRGKYKALNRNVYIKN
ncbi:MAG: hypothetical protein ACT4ON_10685 [Bacteroidota bacterium]